MPDIEQKTNQLLETLRHPDARVRVRTIQSLAKISDPRGTSALLDALNDPEPRVRAAAAAALGKMRSAEAKWQLLERLGDEDAKVRLAAAEALGDLADPDAVPGLSQAVRDAKESALKIAAVHSLHKIGGPSALSALQAAARDSAREVQEAASYAVASLQGGEAKGERIAERIPLRWVVIGLLCAACVVLLLVSAWRWMTPAGPATVPVEPLGEQSHPPRVPQDVLWIEDCDPRDDTQLCKHVSGLADLDQFYGAITSVKAVLTYEMPVSESDLTPYDVVIANFCGPAAHEHVFSWLKSYVTSGGSVIALGDNFCLGVESDNGLWASSALAASAFTSGWGITFSDDDDSVLQWADPVSGHPLTQGITKLYTYRHAYLIVQEPAQVIATIGNKPFIGLYDQAGTVIAIPNIGFHWGTDFKQEIASSDNFSFWRSMLVWLAEQSRSKRK